MKHRPTKHPKGPVIKIEAYTENVYYINKDGHWVDEEVVRGPYFIHLDIKPKGHDHDHKSDK